MTKQFIAQCPANLALVKYMGKCDLGKNLARNDSLSLTLDHLYSTVILQPQNNASNFSSTFGAPWLPSLNFILALRVQIKVS